MGSLESVVEAVNGPINGLVWGWPTVSLIALTGIALMLGLQFMPLLKLSYGMRMLLQPVDRTSEGEISPFQALMTSSVGHDRYGKHRRGRRCHRRWRPRCGVLDVDHRHLRDCHEIRRGGPCRPLPRNGSER